MQDPEESGRYWLEVSLALADEGVLFLYSLNVGVIPPSNMRTNKDRVPDHSGRCCRMPCHIYGITTDR